MLGPKGLHGGVRIELLTDWPERVAPGRRGLVRGRPSRCASRASRRGGRIPVAAPGGVDDARGGRGARGPLPRSAAARTSRRRPTTGTTSSACGWSRAGRASRSASWSRSSAPAATRCTASSARPASGWFRRCAAPSLAIDLEAGRHGRRRPTMPRRSAERADRRRHASSRSSFELPAADVDHRPRRRAGDRGVRHPRPARARARPPSVGRRLPVRRGSGDGDAAGAAVRRHRAAARRRRPRHPARSRRGAPDRCARSRAGRAAAHGARLRSVRGHRRAGAERSSIARSASATTC